MKQKKNYRGIDLTNMRFGKLVVIKRIKENSSSWVCKCDCGNEVVVCASRLLDRTKSCGCALKEVQAQFGKNNTTHGDSYTNLYHAYRSMIDRCYQKKCKNYKRYGARGITVCDEWKKSYTNFRDWALKNGFDYNKSRTEQSIDRIDNDGNYCPENCRWATAQQQADNRSTTTFYDFRGEKITASKFAEKFGIKNKDFVYGRLERGRTLEDVLYEWNFQNNIPDNVKDCKTYAEEHGINSVTVKRHIKNGKLKSLKVGRKYYVIT